MCDLSGLDVRDVIEHPRDWELEIAMIQREGDKAERRDMLRALLFPGLLMIVLVAIVLYAILH